MPSESPDADEKLLALTQTYAAEPSVDVAPGPLKVRAESAQSVSQGTSLVGQRIGGYRVVRLLGQGGMGEVYEAVHDHLGQ